MSDRPDKRETLRLGPQFGLDSPEAQALIDAKVSARVEALLPELMAKLAGVQQATGGTPNGEDKGFVQALALQLAELTGQGTGRIYVAPEIVESRRKALDRLKELLLDLRARREVPAYRLKNKVVLNLGPRLGDTLIDPLYRDNQKIVQSTEIDWPGIPNGAMQPINEAAERVYALFCEWTGSATSAEADEFLAITSHGAVVRGEAASQILRNDRRRGEVGFEEAHEGAATIRRHDQAPVQKVQVLGTLTAPVEIS